MTPGACVTRPYRQEEARADILAAQRDHAATIQAFHALVYGQRHTWGVTRFEGVPVLKIPQDLWTYHEWMEVLRPTLVIETGTAKGGSALFFARQMERWGGGTVLTIDVETHDGRPTHEAITYLTGSSLDPDVREFCAWRARHRADPRVMVVLDSCHDAVHVRAELDVYASLVSVGQLLVVEDTNIAGPGEALAGWWPRHQEFQPEVLCERHLLTFSPSGWLRRVS